MKLALNIITIARASFARWRVFGAACLAHILHDGYASMIYLLLPSWQTELALSLTQVGILKTVYSAAMESKSLTHRFHSSVQARQRDG